jgi:hypothetical protein
MEYVHDHLPPAEKGVANEFARPQSNGVVGHACGGRLTTDKPPEIRGRICVDMRAETLLGNVGGRSSKISRSKDRNYFSFSILHDGAVEVRCGLRLTKA